MRGLLVIEPLYHQIVSGKKTQTRRSGGLDAINGRKASKNKEAIITDPDNWEETGCTMVLTKFGTNLESVDFCDCKETLRNVTCTPRYKVGEILYLKEPLKTVDGKIIYAYDHPIPTYESGMRSDFYGQGYKNKLFMPESDARVFIRITAIKCERLLSISDEDCVAEGIHDYSLNGMLFGYYNYMSRDYASYDIWELSPKESFISLYKFANKMKRSVEMPNPWVWVYTFEVVL